MSTMHDLVAGDPLTNRGACGPIRGCAGLRRVARWCALGMVLGLAMAPASSEQCAFFPGCTTVVVNPGVVDVDLRCAEGDRIELLDDDLEVSSGCAPDAVCVVGVQVRLFARCVGGVWNTGIDVTF